MAVTVTSPVTGGAQTGFTSPTYTLSADNAPTVNGRQWWVSGTGGTQSGVTLHTAGAPFTITVNKCQNYRLLGKPNPMTGIINNVPMNSYVHVVRKGVTPAANQPVKIATLRLIADIPAGADTYDAANIRAMYSLMAGAIAQQSAGFGDTAIQNTI